MFRSAKLIGYIAQWACLLSEYNFKIVTRQGKSHLNGDGLSQCLPKGGHCEAEVEEEDELKVFSLMARASPMLEEGGDRIQLSKVAARLSREYDDDRWYCDIMATSRRETTGEPIVRFEHFSWSPPSRLLLRRDEDGIDKVYVTSGDVNRVLSIANGTRANGHFGVEGTLCRLRLLFWWPSM